MSVTVKDVFDKSAMIPELIREAARAAVTRICADAKEAAVQHITTQVYDTPESASYRRTGAARAAIFVRSPGEDTYYEAVADGLGRNPTKGVISTEEINQNPDVAQGLIGAGMDYSVFIEEGHEAIRVSVPPRPFMSPAFEQVAPTFEGIALNEVGKAMRRL